MISPAVLGPLLGALVGSLATLATQALDRRHRKGEKEDEIEVEEAKLLHQSEIEFRKSLLERIRQLEQHDREKSDRIAAQARRIAELEEHDREKTDRIAAQAQRIRQLEACDREKAGRIAALTEENGELKAKITGIEGRHDP